METDIDLTPIPEEFLYGIDIAIKKLCPNAVFRLQGVTIIEWQDPDNPVPPSLERIFQQVDADEKKYLEYISNNGQNHSS